jgi:hypothetical protein
MNKYIAGLFLILLTLYFATGVFAHDLDRHIYAELKEWDIYLPDDPKKAFEKIKPYAEHGSAFTQIARRITAGMSSSGLI